MTRVKVVIEVDEDLVGVLNDSTAVYSLDRIDQIEVERSFDQLYQLIYDMNHRRGPRNIDDTVSKARYLVEKLLLCTDL